MTTPVAPDPASSEPVMIAHAVTVILAGLCGLGWITIPDQTIDLIGTGVVLVLSTLAAVVARGKVTPAGKPSASLQLYVQAVVRQEVAELSALQGPPARHALRPEPQSEPTAAFPAVGG